MAHSKRRILYGISFLILLMTEVLIALFVQDSFIRPYGGDVLVTLLLCCFVRIFFPVKLGWMPVYVFLFSCLVEVGQYFNLVSLLGLEDNTFFRIVLGASFSFPDIFCYGMGCFLFWLIDTRVEKIFGKQELS